MPLFGKDSNRASGSRKNSWRNLIIGGSVLALGLLIAHYLWASMFWTLTFRHIRLALPIYVPLLVVALAIAVGFFKGRKDDSSSYFRGEKTFVPSVIIGTSVVGLVALIGAFVFPLYADYQRAQEYASSVTVEAEGAVDFTVRTPYPVAVRSSQNAMGDLTGGDIDYVKYTASDAGSEYTFLVRSRGLFAGYKAVVDLDGSRCIFDEETATRRVDGWFGNNLHRLLNQKERNVFFSAADVYGYCDDETPMVVMPLKQVKGVFPAYEVPAGVAIYNGTTGELTIQKEVKDGELPGPVYPQSLAAESRNSLRASGSWWEYVRNLVGYGTTERDGEDPNINNRSEYGLLNADRRGAYVTPLVTNGGSTAITALGIQYYGSNVRGELNPYEVSRYEEPQVSNGQAASVIRATFSDLNWQNGMTIFEVTPSEGNKRIATLGLNQAIQYRVEFDNETYCLQDSRGNEIRCASLNGDGEAEGTNGEIAGVDISTLSDADLIRLIGEVSTEQQKRLDAKQQ